MGRASVAKKRKAHTDAQRFPWLQSRVMVDELSRKHRRAHKAAIELLQRRSSLRPGNAKDNNFSFTVTSSMWAESESWGVDASPRLPVGTIRASYKVRIDSCHQNGGHVLVGVCNAWTGGESPSRCGWGLDVGDMKLHRVVMGAASDEAASDEGQPPLGFPDGHLTVVGATSHGLRGKANGSVIEVMLDFPDDGPGAASGSSSKEGHAHDGTGTLSFRVGRHTHALVALDGFPRDAELRPWAALRHEGDRVTLLSGWHGYRRAVDPQMPDGGLAC